MYDEGLEWLPPGGVHLRRDEVVDLAGSLRSILDGTAIDEPNRSHAITIANVLGRAIERAGGET